MLEPIILWDATSWRRGIFAEYKANRDEEPKTANEKKAHKLREDFKKQLPHIRLGLSLLGVRQMIAMNYEADDLAAFMVDKSAGKDIKIVMVSGDKDWVQLVGPGVTWLDPVQNVRLNDRNISKRLGIAPGKDRIQGFTTDQGEGFIGVPSAHALLEIKALKGDKGDNIPGIGGIGEKGALEFVRTFTTLSEFFNGCIVDKTIDVEKLPKKFRNLACEKEKHELLRRNMRLMDLRSKARPEPVNRKMTHAPLDLPGFERFCRQHLFTSFLTDLPGWCEPFNTLPWKLAA
jgi:5'-3' exonuclease